MTRIYDYSQDMTQDYDQDYSSDSESVEFPEIPTFDEPEPVYLTEREKEEIQGAIQYEIEKDMEALAIAFPNPEYFDLEEFIAERRSGKQIQPVLQAPKPIDISELRMAEVRTWLGSKGCSLTDFPGIPLEILHAEMLLQKEADAKVVPEAVKEPEKAPEKKPERKLRGVLNPKGKIQGIKKLAPVIKKEKVVPVYIPKKEEVVYQPVIDFEEAEDLEVAMPVREVEKVAKVEIKVEKPVSKPKPAPVKSAPILVKQTISVPAPVSEPGWETVKKVQRIPSAQKRPDPVKSDQVKTNPVKTRMCNTVVNGGKCRFGSACNFAHTVYELRRSECKFGPKCLFVRQGKAGLYENTRPTDRVCCFWHPNEEPISYGKRNGFRV